MTNRRMGFLLTVATLLLYVGVVTSILLLN
jgi:hypothetical protein